MEEIEFEEELAPALIAINITKGDEILSEEDYLSQPTLDISLLFTLQYSDEKYYSFQQSIPKIQKSNFRFKIFTI